MKYSLEKGQIVGFKCEVIEIKPNCVIRVKGVNVGDNKIEFETHPNSLFKKKETL